MPVFGGDIAALGNPPAIIIGNLRLRPLPRIFQVDTGAELGIDLIILSGGDIQYLADINVRLETDFGNRGAGA